MMTDSLRCKQRMPVTLWLVVTRGFLAVVLLLAVPSISRPAGDYYVWVDEGGITNYGERPPAGVDAEYVTTPQRFGERISAESDKSVDTRPATAAGTTSTVDPDELVREQRQALEEEVARIKRKNCEIGRRNLERLTTHPRIRFTDENGDVRILPEEERQAKIKGVRQIVQENCDV